MADPIPDAPEAPSVTKTVETTTKAVTAAQPPISTYFDDMSRLIMALFAFLSFDAFVGALIWKDKLTTEMITLILGLFGGSLLGAAWQYWYGSSSGSKAKDQIAQVKNP